MHTGATRLILASVEVEVEVEGEGASDCRCMVEALSVQAAICRTLLLLRFGTLRSAGGLLFLAVLLVVPLALRWMQPAWRTPTRRPWLAAP